MSDLQRGPLELFDPAGVRPMPARPSFEGIVAGALGDVPGLDAAMGGSASAIADGAAGDDDGFAGELAGAVGDGADAPGDNVPAALGDVASTGDNLDTLRQSVSDVLPPPDAPVTIDYEPPPPPPDVSAGPGDRDRNPPTGEVLEP